MNTLFDEEYENQQSSRIRRSSRKRSRISLPSLGSVSRVFERLPSLWWVELTGILLTAVQMAGVVKHYEIIQAAIVSAVLAVGGFFGKILLIIGIVLIFAVLLRLGFRRRRYYY